MLHDIRINARAETHAGQGDRLFATECAPIGTPVTIGKSSVHLHQFVENTNATSVLIIL